MIHIFTATYSFNDNVWSFSLKEDKMLIILTLYESKG